MASITIYDVPDELKDSLEAYAAEHGLTLQAYLRQGIARMPGANTGTGADILVLADILFGDFGDTQLDLSGRESNRPPVEFDP